MSQWSLNKQSKVWLYHPTPSILETQSLKYKPSMANQNCNLQSDILNATTRLAYASFSPINMSWHTVCRWGGTLCTDKNPMPTARLATERIRDGKEGQHKGGYLFMVKRMSDWHMHCHARAAVWKSAHNIVHNLLKSNKQRRIWTPAWARRSTQKRTVRDVCSIDVSAYSSFVYLATPMSIKLDLPIY